MERSTRIDIVWDTYQSDSLKESTRQKRGKGVRRKVSGRAKLPSNWVDFLRDPNNKSELFALLTSKVASFDFPPNKAVYVTSGQSVISTMSTEMMNCNHEDADTRIIVHVLHALCQGMKSVKVRTVDTDVVIILTGAFFELSQAQPLVDMHLAWVKITDSTASTQSIPASASRSHVLYLFSTPSLAVTPHPPSRERVRSQLGRHGKHMKEQQRHYNTLLVNLFSTWIQILIISRRSKD